MALKSLEPFIEPYAIQVVRILCDQGIENRAVETALMSLDLMKAAGPDAASEAVPTLNKALGREDESLRVAVCDLLGYLGKDAEEALTKLVSVASDRESGEGVQLAAIRAMISIAGIDTAAKLLSEATPDLIELISLLRSGREAFTSLRREIQKRCKDAKTGHVRTELQAEIQDGLDRLPHPQKSLSKAAECSGWSKPKGITHWKKIFGVSYPSMKKMLDDGTVRRRKVSARKYQICTDDLPLTS
jgi:hypothetical protein